MYRSFWREVLKPEAGLFATRDRALPRPDANEDRLKLVGLVLCKSILAEQPIGPGLCRFVYEFLIEDHGRSFDPELPMERQVIAALEVLRDYDSELARSWEVVYNGFTSGHGAAGLYIIEEFAPNHPDKDQNVTADNVGEAIVAGCRYTLWESCEAQLLALRAGFSMREFSNPIALASQLAPMHSAELMLFIEGESVLSLVEQITWSDDGDLARAELVTGFPPGSSTCALLKKLLSDEGAFPPGRRQQFLEWATGRSVVPALGLGSTANGKIKLRWDEAVQVGDDESKWRLPQPRTCFHEVRLPNYSDMDVLLKKLLLAIDHRDDGFAEIVE